MTGEAGRELTLLRAGILAVVGLLGGTLAHTAAGGLTPDPAWFLVMLGIAWAIALPVLRRPQSVARIAVLAVAAQTLVHLVLTMASGHDEPGGTAAGSGAAGDWQAAVVGNSRLGTAPDGHTDHIHVIGGAQGTLMAALPAPLARLAGEFTLDHAPMMATHLGAALLLGLWLGWAEQALWRLLSLVPRPLLRLLLPVAVPSLPRPTPAPAPLTRRPVLVELSKALARRGPPRLLPV